MSVVWIVTTGNSDVKLTDDTGWGALRIKKMEQLYPCENYFSPSEESNSDLLTLPARVMGIAYGDAIETYWERLTFSLLDGFCQEFKTEKRNKPDRIIVLLTDQEAIFDACSRGDAACPYWQDKYTLQPILRHYFTQMFGEKFANEKIEFSVLKPQQGADGLDDWDATLTLVKAELARWEENKWISKSDRVIVSHQAGTPAISSAVQLTCLIRFGKKVEFLVSSELAPDKTKFLKGSSYFETLQFKKLENLLARDDYAGVASVVDSLGLEDSVLKVRLDHLLEVAKLWNAAKFDEFANRMSLVTPSRVREWWWKGYEMAYLAVVRMKNGDPTEALFHSVRAIEGLICEWAIATHASNIHYSFIKLDRNGNPALDVRGNKIREYDSRRYRGDKEGSPIAKHTINSRFKYPNQKDDLRRNKLGLYGRVLYTLFESTFEPSSRLTDHPISIVWEQLADERNELFHRLRGMTPQEVYEAWGKGNQEEWAKVLLDCLNLVAGQSFASLKSASLMSQVHKDLEEVIKAIAAY
ncbi:hypothetical protein [Pseudanabaena mucicola]|uniref:CRISPR-associated protein n=1 Tax=Pseudanabaena mucicola FACHB-723 TaxID=2692860 RepID=A0ABR8A1V3_9CYAN|nr:hypothetical protein [Pseudanabaena mucicola]MBD2190034.1 hypothetical protein [Pseudanabaena mucicola FACHB-723]